MVANAPEPRCPCCGWPQPGARCTVCTGTATALRDDRAPLRRERGGPLADFADGLRTFAHGCGQLLHHRAFVGRIGVPIAANLVAFALAAAALAWLAWPGLERAFAAPWPVADAWRLAHRDSAPLRLLLATAWWLWPLVFDAIAGGACAVLLPATDAAIGGVTAASGSPAPADLTLFADRMRWRARLGAVQIVLLPAVWLLAMLPYAGLPIALVLASAVAGIVFCEPPARRRGLDAAQFRADLGRNAARVLGFGCGCQLALLVPFVDCLLLVPAATVGGAALHWRLTLGPSDRPPA